MSFRFFFFFFIFGRRVIDNFLPTANLGEIGHHQHHGKIEGDKPNQNADVGVPIGKVVPILLILL